MNFIQAKDELRTLGLTLSRAGERAEYRVNFRGGIEASAYYTNDLEDAVRTGRAMATRAAQGVNKKTLTLSPERHSMLIAVLKGVLDVLAGDGDEDTAEDLRKLIIECGGKP